MPGEGFWTANHIITPDPFVHVQGNNRNGYFYYTQLIRRQYEPYFRNGREYVAASGYYRDTFELDNWVVYQVVVGHQPILSARSFTDLIMIDSPAVSGRLGEGPFYDKIDWNDAFMTFVMYVPPGHAVKPVPIIRYNWNFKAQLLKEPFSYRIVTNRASQVQGPHETAEHPVWTSTFHNDTLGRRSR
jgi:hypothetical protein